MGTPTTTGFRSLMGTARCSPPLGPRAQRRGSSSSREESQWMKEDSSLSPIQETTGSRSSTPTERSSGPLDGGARAMASLRDWRGLRSTARGTSWWPTGRTTGSRYSDHHISSYQDFFKDPDILMCRYSETLTLSTCNVTIYCQI